MDLFDFGIVALAIVMVWLLYKVTRETREYAAPHVNYVYRMRVPDVWGRHHDAQTGDRHHDALTRRRGVR
jgi:hypothetical protein